MDNELHTISDALQKIADALADFSETVSGLFGGYFDMQELPELPERTRWKPVRYIRAADRRTDRRPPVHCVRSALSPNRKKDRRTGRKAIT